MRKPFRPSRQGRAVAVAAAALAMAIVPAGSAVADKAKVTADRSAWFWSSNEKVTACNNNPGQPACAGVSPAQGAYGNTLANPISPGHLGVSLNKGESDMRSYVHFPAVIPQGAALSKVTLTLPLSLPTSGHAQQHADARGRPPGTNDPANEAKIQACLMRAPWGDNVANGGGGDPPQSTEVSTPAGPGDPPPQVTVKQNEPAADCNVTAPGERNEAGTAFVFDLTEIAQRWTGGELLNEGVAVVALESGPNDNWILEFHGPPLTLASNGQEVVAVSPADAVAIDIESVGGFTPPPPTKPPVITPGPQFPSFGTPVPTFQPPPPIFDNPPAVVTPQPPVTFTPVATSTGTTPGWVLLVLPLGIAGLAGMARSISTDPFVPQLVTVGSNNSVATVLHSRRLGPGG